MPDTNLNKLKAVLTELFILDQADLDFGIYRVMNAKRAEVTRFLDNDLLPQVRTALAHHSGLVSMAKQAELDQAVENARRLGVNPDAVPKVQELRDALQRDADPADLENEVFSDLANFFRRYYQGGDFLALRRYKAGVYAIPYEGEEVKLHWANADQYYIKTSEYLRDYTFKLPDGKRVHFKLVEADTEADNKKAAAGQERRFILCAAEPLLESNGELVIRFEYRPDPDKRKQADLNAIAAQQIFATPGAGSGSPSPGGEGQGEGDLIGMRQSAFRNWLPALAAKAPTEKNPNRTLLEKHLADYTARNTFDYFIHKDIGGFLRRELDFFIKNEIMHLDDIEAEQAPRVEQYLAKIKAIRAIARKIIAFLEQLENFQKKLWLKKKFVVETQWCVTLDRVPESLYPEITANDAQRAEWVQLFAIDEIKASAPGPPAKQGELIPAQPRNLQLPTAGYSVPLTAGFLKANPFLVLDTKFFSADFKEKLLADNRILGGAVTLDGVTDGLLVNSENFQALALLQSHYAHSIQCIYIDPPYNTGFDGFIYKDSYATSTWATCLHNRLALTRAYLSKTGVLFSSINEIERATLDWILRIVFGKENRVEELIWVQDTVRNNSPTYSTNHEYVEVFAANKSVVEKQAAMFREQKPGYAEITDLVGKKSKKFASIKEVEVELAELMRQHRREFEDDLRQRGEDVEDGLKNDPWNGIYPYRKVEYRNAVGKLIPEAEAAKENAMLWVWREVDPSMPSGKQAASTKDPESENYRYYKPPHPKTGRPCTHPKRGWAFPRKVIGDRPSLDSYVADDRIVFKDGESMPPQIKYFLHEVADIVSKSVMRQYSDGEQHLDAMFGRKEVFPNPKPPALIGKFVAQTCGKSDTVLDFFGGSGTTGQAVINLNREDGGKRKYILIEMGDYFDTVLKPRIQKVIYSKDWKDGKPVSRAGSSHLFKYLRLESYEDALNNLELKRTTDQDDLLHQHAPLREDYLLRYQLDVETRDSASLLNLAQFANPFAYQLKIATGSVGESRPVTVDLVETFNYLLGLRVAHLDTIRGFRVVQGHNPAGEKVLVIWRNVAEKSNADLDAFFQKQGYNTKDMEFTLIYVNGDNNLENLKRPDETWKVRRTEDEFKRLMFDVQDV